MPPTKDKTDTTPEPTEAEKQAQQVKEAEDAQRAEEERRAAEAEKEAADADAAAASAENTGASGELVSVNDPRAAAEIDSMLAQIVGDEPSAQEILQAIVGGEDLPEANAQQSQASIVGRILSAGTAEGVLDMGEPIKAEELEAVALKINGVRWMRSTFEEGPGVYAVMDAVRIDSEEPVKVTCGGVNVMTQLLRLQTMGALPQTAKIVKAARPTRQGYYPYWLQPA